MATHFVCQSTEPLPHVYPSGIGNHSHGAVSQYEVYNESSKPHTRFPPPGWDFSQTSSEDSLPLIQHVPQSEWRNTSFHPDPNLCVTPQRPLQYSRLDGRSESANPLSLPHQKPDIDPDPLLTLTPIKGNPEDNVDKVNGQGKKHRVRFDVEEEAEKWDDEESVMVNNLDHKLPQKTSPEKVYQPELYGDDNDKFDFENTEGQSEKEQSYGSVPQPNQSSKTVKYTVSKVNNKSVYVPLPETIMKNDVPVKAIPPPNPVNSTQNKKSSVKNIGPNTVTVIREKHKTNTNSVNKSDLVEIKDPIASCVVPEEYGPRRKVKVLRENQCAPRDSEYTYPFDQDPLAYAGGEEHMFARPEYNSTLRMKVEAEKLKKSEIDIEKALQKKLTMSESTKTSIHEKAASHVNTDGETFSGLVSLNVPVDELCKQVAEQKTTRAKQVKVAKKKLKDQKEPDLLDFFTEDRQKESVSFTTTGISAPSEKLSTVQHRRAFDLYKHNRVWERRGYRK